MVCYEGKRFGTIIEIAEEIYDNIKDGECSKWDFATANTYICDKEILNDIENVELHEILYDFKGWGGCNILTDYRYDGTDLVLIGDQYGGGAFASVVLPEGIKCCETYETRDYWIDAIAAMICTITCSVDGYGKNELNTYICLESEI